VRRHGELDDTEASAEVPADLADHVDHVLAHLGAELTQLPDRKLAQIVRRVDAPEERVVLEVDDGVAEIGRGRHGLKPLLSA
jgi:hypothetical protein